MPPTIWTIGHSNHPIETFLDLVGRVPIDAVADVRRFPASRHHPQFNRDALAEALAQTGIDYHHFEALGGRRQRSDADSPNTAWRVEAFNAYADHAGTPEFHTALDELASLAEAKRTAILCAEALPWRCHRRIIADVLIAREWTVEDIFPGGQVKPHELTPFAQVSDGSVTYPGGTLFS